MALNYSIAGYPKALAGTTKEVRTTLEQIIEKKLVQYSLSVV
jgi:hypothetical protein